jgi:hypothetical protein
MSRKHGGGFFGADGQAHNSAAFAKRKTKSQTKSKKARRARRKNR